MKNLEWKFNDPPNVAVIVSKNIISSKEWIAYVSHDSDDGAWQFHTSHSLPVTENDVALVSLQSIVNLDNSITDLVDLPLGWCAWRKSVSDVWQKAPITD
ncbi:hypothetical protein EJO82_21875 [Salmonella enterica]|nr:hypothetical protein [Salmonella enterica]EEG1124334.1 hypothetical protein [Salmonella enterica subsp. diarizonae]EGF0852087.1 hypothetical protein [Salmonella enterica]EJM2521279.1 hypothetical protein [Salmonella enterica]ELO0596880.1 hypothetical protein [Salmonella enterica]